MKQDNLQYVTNQAGEKTAVILPINEFEALLEDLQDLASIAERRNDDSISHDELLAELKRDGVI
jgi:PHD/YefM family antitoxin component YafN of YafNO toxin-antitoxin module